MAVKKATATKSTSTKGRLSKNSKPARDETAGDKEVTIDRRRQPRREESEVAAAPAKLERRTKVQRRRQIDPTTCERDYSEEEVAFMNAMDEYKRTSGRMFPTCSEVLEVIRGLGYVLLTPAEIAVVRPEVANSVPAENTVETEDEEELDFQAH
jgi:hypothetical protein